jgi:hypothetical protein
MAAKKGRAGGKRKTEKRTKCGNTRIRRRATKCANVETMRSSRRAQRMYATCVSTANTGVSLLLLQRRTKSDDRVDFMNSTQTRHIPVPPSARAHDLRTPSHVARLAGRRCPRTGFQTWRSDFQALTTAYKQTSTKGQNNFVTYWSEEHHTPNISSAAILYARQVLGD